MTTSDFASQDTALILADGFEEMEAVMTLDTLRRGGVFVISASITGQPAVTGSHSIKVVADTLFEDLNFTGIRGLVLPGGRGCEHYYTHSGLINLIKRLDEESKFIAAICAAPAFLAWAGVLAGRRAAFYPGTTETLGEAGSSVIWTKETAVRDGHFITAKGPGYSIEFALLIISALMGKTAAEEARSRIYP